MFLDLPPLLPPRKLTCHLKIGTIKGGNIIFQPSFFRGHMFFLLGTIPSRGRSHIPPKGKKEKIIDSIVPAGRGYGLEEGRSKPHLPQLHIDRLPWVTQPFPIWRVVTSIISLIEYGRDKNPSPKKAGDWKKLAALLGDKWSLERSKMKISAVLVRRWWCWLVGCLGLLLLLWWWWWWWW